MKRTIVIMTVLLSIAASSTAQKKDSFFSIEHPWMKMAGYSYQPAYPYGVSTAGGSFLSVGFGEPDKEYITTDGKTRVEPSYSVRLGWVGYTFDEGTTGWGAISFRPMIVMGVDMTNDYDVATDKTKRNSYFTMAPTLAVNIYMFHFSVGYEIVPKLSQFNGLTFGVGLSIRYNRPRATDKVVVTE